MNEINGKNSYFLEYYNKIKSGEIIAGQELILQFENLINDLNNPDYYYDNSEAEFRISFIEKFCKHTRSPFFGKPFILELWEKAFIEVFYSFKIKSTKLRRFKKAILLIARKNGKSTFCAAISLSEFFCGNGGTDIVCSSNDDAQANIIFDEINNMREWSKCLNKRSHKNLKGMFNLKNKSTIKKLSDRTRNKEGRNIDVGVLDEVHEMKTNIIGKSIEQSQSTKDEPILFMITTEGFINDGYLDEELVYARKVLNGEIEDISILVWLYTQDSENEIWQDENSWYKSNPSLGTVKKKHYLQGQILKAQQSKSDRVFTLAKDFNIKQNNATAWLSETEYINPAIYDIEKFRGCVGIGGIDLSETTDLTCAKIMVMLKNDTTKYIITKYFIPETKIETGAIEDKKNYLEWAKMGLIEICPGNENDYSKVVEWFFYIYKQFGVKIWHVGYDNWQAKDVIAGLNNLGCETEKVKMDFDVMSNPMKLVEADLKSNLINYNNNPIDKWCLGNTALKIDNIGRIMPVKVGGQSNKRIDGAVTLIILYAIYMRYKTEFLEMLR